MVWVAGLTEMDTPSIWLKENVIHLAIFYFTTMVGGNGLEGIWDVLVAGSWGE